MHYGLRLARQILDVIAGTSVAPEGVENKAARTNRPTRCSAQCECDRGLALLRSGFMATAPSQEAPKDTSKTLLGKTLSRLPAFPSGSLREAFQHPEQPRYCVCSQEDPVTEALLH